MKSSSQEIFFIFFVHIKNRSYFSFMKKPIFLFPKNRYDFSFIKKPLLFSSQKNIFDFSKPNSNFLSQQLIWILFYKEEDAFISKLVWFSFVHMCNILFMSCIKGYIGHKRLEDQIVFGWNGCLTPSHSIT